MAATKYGWVITSQVTGQTIIDNAGNIVVGTITYFTTGQGNQGQVFIPDTQQNVKNVTEAVRAKAKLLDDIGALSENWDTAS